jgi:DNA-binding transcriptional ArsR family regulator
LKIEIDVTSPGDLLVKEGQTVAANQLIADRQSERSTLSAQLQETNLAIEKLKAAPKVSQLPPAGVKTLTSLPPKTSYGEEQAQITAAAAKVRDLERKYALAQAAAKTTLPETEKVRGSRIAVKQAEEKIARHQQKIDALKTLEDIDPAVKEHEEVKLRELNRSLIEAQTKLEQDIATEGIAKATRSSHLADAQFQITEAQRNLQLARARLTTATEKRRQLEFDYRIKETEHGEQVQRSELERVKLQEAGKLQAHDREYQIAQLVLKKGQIQKQLETIGVVRTPHQGTIRRVKLVAQHGNLLRYEVALIYAPNTPKPNNPVSQWQEEKS